MRGRWKLPIVVGLGVLVAVSTVLQNLQNGSSQEAWRPFVLLGAVLAGVVAAWQLLAGALLSAPEPTSLTPADPRRVGPYTVVARLGVGAMGRAYLAHRRDSGEFVALKVIRPEYAEHPEFRRRFAREVRAVAGVESPYTTNLIDADTDAEQPWLVTTYVAGPSLQHAVDEHGPWPVDAVWRLGAGTAEALRAIHSAGVVHRDLKPSNILLDTQNPRVIDFGIARARDASQLTGTENRPGTPAYMAPEQATGGEVGPAADVFALGAVLAYAATGRTPFGDGASDVVLYRVVHQPPDLSGLDGELRALVDECLDKDPRRRPTPEQVAQRCAAQVAALGGALDAASGSPTDRGAELGWLPAQVAADLRGSAAALPAARGRSDRMRWATILTALVALLVAVGSITMQMRPGQAGTGRDRDRTITAPRASGSPSASPTPTPFASPLPSSDSPTPAPSATSPRPRTTSAARPAPIMLVGLAGSAQWRNGQQAFAYGTDHEEEWGFAVIKGPSADALENGVHTEYLETVPEWVSRGQIHGAFNLPRPVAPGDRFRATVGFEYLDQPPATEVTEFRVTGTGAGRTHVMIGRVHDVSDGTLQTIDFDLSSIVGYTQITLSVYAPADSVGPVHRSVWVRPRIER